MNTQLGRATAYLNTLDSVLEYQIKDAKAIIKRDGGLTVEAHNQLAADLHSVETSAKLARECVLESLRRQLREEK